MTTFWILILIFSNMYTVQPGRHCVTAQSLTESPVYQPNKEISVDIGDSATLQCCIFKKIVWMIAWFKQPSREKPQTIVTAYKSAEETFYDGFQNSHFKIERSSNCCNMTILNIIQSDEAMYYCAQTRPRLMFGDGTYLKIKGAHVAIASETSKPVLCGDSVVCEPTPNGNNTNMITQEKTVLGLGAALGVCVLLIFCLTYFILRRRKCKNSGMKVCTENSPGIRQELEAETLTYTEVQFTERKAKADKRKTGSADECVYTEVKKTVKRNKNNS